MTENMSQHRELEKGIEQPAHVDGGPKTVPRQKARGKLLTVLVIVALICYAFVRVTGMPSMCSHGRDIGRAAEQRLSTNGLAEVEKKVKLEAHIMSKCPDARDCLRDLVVPAMANISDKVDFTLSYIGHLGTPSDKDPVTCMHGPSECLGNILELCASHLYPDPKIYLGFAMCLSADYTHIPQVELVKECALEHAVDFERLNDCASKEDGAYGMELLRGSVKRSEDVGVRFSCTVRLNDKVRCIRDGGKWKDCPGGSSVEELIRDVNQAAKS